MNTSAKFKVNWTETVGVVQTSIFKSNQGQKLSNTWWNFHKICVLRIYNSEWTLLPSIPLADDKILDRSNLKQSADNNFEFDENSKKFFKRVENTVGKGEIACYKQFLLSPQCFQRLLS